MIQVFQEITQPSPHLQPFVKDYMLLHFLSGQHDAIPVKPFPANTEHCLVFYLQGHVTAVAPNSAFASVYPKIAVNGSQLSRFDFHISPKFKILSVQFQPGVLSKFIRQSLTPLTDVRLDGEALLPPAIRRVHDQMVNAKTSQEIIGLLEAYLWKKINSSKMEFLPIDAVTRRITEGQCNYPVEKMAVDACLSISQFERRFIQLTGITPKLYARINRFYRAYQMKEQHPNADWLTIALHTGYHDYQHLVKDFRQFSNTTPQSLLLAQANSPDGIYKALLKR